jgi:RND family efflux transporter MFP subunit
MKRKTVALLLSIIFVLVACKGNEAERSAHEAKLITGVRTARPVFKTTPKYYETTGSVKAKNTSMVSAKLMGTVEAIYVKEGQWVKKGDALLKIYSPEVTAKVRQAEKAVEEARRAVEMAKKQKAFAEATYRRYEALYKEKAISEQEFDQIRTQTDVAVLQYERAQKAFQRAQAALDEARAYEGYLTLRAPQSGRIAEKKIDVGTMTAPGMPLFVIEEPEYQVVFSVDESLLGRLKKGDEIEIAIKAINYSGTVKVTELVPSVDPQTRTFTVKADLPEVDGLRGGLYAEIKVPVGKKERLLVPKTALFHWGALEAVYVVEKDRTVRLRLIRTGKSLGEYIEVLSGLDPDEEIVVEGVERVADGVKLR